MSRESVGGVKVYETSIQMNKVEIWVNFMSGKNETSLKINTLI